MPKCKKTYGIPWGRCCNAECIFCHTMRQKENGGWSCNKVSAHLICTLPCWEYSTHRNSWYSPECTCISLVGCTDLCTLPLLPQTAIDPSVVVVTCAAVPQATQTKGNTAEESTVVGVSRVLRCQMASRLIFWSSPNSFSPPLLCGVRGVQQRTFSSSDEHLLLVCLRFDLWTGVVKSTVFGSRSR